MDKNEPILPQEEQIETPAVPEDPGYTYEDIQKESIRDIASNTEEPKVEEKPEEKPTETPVEEVKVDTEQIAKEAARIALEEQEVKRQAEEQERIKTEEKPEELTAQQRLEKEYLEYKTEYETKFNKSPEWFELAAYADNRKAEKALLLLEEKQKANEIARQTELDKVKLEQEENTKKINAIVDDELAMLYRKGDLTPVKDKDNPSDQGLLERKALFTRWAEINNERRAVGKPDILSASAIMYGVDEAGKPYYTRPNAQPPGANAPIAGNKGSAVPPSTEQTYTNADLKRPWSMFRRN